LMGGSSDVFSGVFYPVEWVKNQYILLKANPFYPGGRSYLDSVKVIFYDTYYPDVFLADPGAVKEKFVELDSGVYQNIYISFPEGKESKTSGNARIALYTLLKEFFKLQVTKARTGSAGALDPYSNMTDLNSLTSNEESPVTLNIQTFPGWKVKSILRNSKVNLYILFSLKQMEAPFNEFLKQKDIQIDTIYLKDTQLINFMNNTTVDYLLVGKTFIRSMPIEEKIKIILKEMSFDRFDETYLKLLNQLDEVKYLDNEELTMDLVSKIVEKVVEDGIILPLFQKRYSLYVKDNVKGIELDYYGKPLFRDVRVK
jgi:MarR-like DNA-binding transcriptional regulator SgrR of sgrS sRNA